MEYLIKRSPHRYRHLLDEMMIQSDEWMKMRRSDGPLGYHGHFEGECRYGPSVSWEKAREERKESHHLCEDGLTIDVTGVISLKSDLTIEVQNKPRNNWLIDFVETIEMDIGKTMIVDTKVGRSLIRVMRTSTEEETLDAPPTLTAKEVTETPPPNVEATSDSSAPVTHAVQSPPQTNPLTADDISRRGRETGPKAFEGMPVDQLMEELDMVTAQQAALVAQLRARLSSERGQSVQKDEEILLLKTQLADAQAEAESSRSYAQKLAEEKMALLVKVEQERADAAEYKASCHWAVKYLEGGKNNHFAGLDDFRQRVEGLLEKQEEKLRKLSIEYDEELYPHMLSTIAERRWLISHGLRLAAMSTLESQEVRQSFGDVVKCALARGKAEAVEELHEKKLLTVPAAQVPGYNQNAYEELVAAMEAMKLLELPHIAQLERDQDYPIDVIMAGLTLARHATEGAEAQPDYFLKPDVAQLQVPIFASPRDILNPFALEKEIPLKESLEAHAIRLAKKKGVKGKAILCGVGAAHLPRSDGVPVSVATVSPKDSELLGKLEEAGNAAYQVGSSERSRCHSI
ncbi:hypothetical protein Tco_1576073 [Tanacetum coccineum]